MSNQIDYGDTRIGAIGYILKAYLHSHWEKPEFYPRMCEIKL